MAPTWDDYLRTGMANFRQMSRTVRGTLDTTSSADKAANLTEGLTGAAAADLATTNLDHALRLCWQVHDWGFPNVTLLRRFVEAVADMVNEGIVKPGVRLRVGADSAKYPKYGAVATLPEEFTRFVERFCDQLNRPHDAVELAAWVEYRVDLADHFFADGCGKIAKTLSAFVLMRAGLPLPNYPDRLEYYAAGPTTRRTEPDPDKDEQFQRFLATYRRWQPVA